MGLYATTTSISELVPVFLKGNTTTVDVNGAALFSRHIDRAEGVVNAYVGARYSLPFSTSTVPPILRTLSEDIASYYALRGAYTQDGQNKNVYHTEYKEALKTLESIRSGNVKLVYTDGSVVPTVSTNRYLSSTEGYTPVFGLDEPDDWKRDSDEIDDQNSARS